MQFLGGVHGRTVGWQVADRHAAPLVSTGSRAWAGMTHEAILEAVRGPWQLAVPPGLPPVLQELLVSALAKNPQDRWARQPDAE